MEVGLFDKRIGFVIQARMASSRLPGKVLMPMPLFSDKSVLDHIIDTLKPLGGRIIVATSSDSSSDPIADFCIDRGVDCFRGNETNVLSRFIAIQEIECFEYVFRFTADNPLIDLNSLIKFFSIVKLDQLDFAYSVGLPLGMNFEVFKGNVLISSVQFITGSLDYEHVTLAIRRMSAIKSSVIRLANYDDLRFTIDTPTDYFLLSFIFEVIRRTGLKGFELFDFLILTYPYLINSNSHVIQSKV